MDAAPQRSPAWFEARLGKWTASSFGYLMAGTATDAFQNLVKDKAWERLTGRPVEMFTTAAMQHGIDTEDEARDWYEFETGRMVRQVGFLVHPSIETMGCSPDGVMDDRMLEIKAPQPRAHLETMTSKKLPAKYRWQVQGQMLICGYERLDFVSYHPLTGGIVVPVEFNPADGKALEERVAMAEELVADLMRRAA